METNDYYAFGGRHAVAGSLASDNRFKFNGKELQTTGDLGYLDYGARMYDDVLGRWFGRDPLAEDFYDITPYSYCFNNPINFVDMFGLYPEDPVFSMGHIGDVFISTALKASSFFSSDNLWMLKDQLAVAAYEDRVKREKARKAEYELLTKEAQLKKLEGLLEKIDYFLNGRTYTDKFGFKWQVNSLGEITGHALTIGMAPSPGKAGAAIVKGVGDIKKGSVFIKSVGNVAKEGYHVTKDNILKAIGKENFFKIVGGNPNIEVNKAGKIVLKGIQKGQSSGKTYNTSLDAKDFF